MFIDPLKKIDHKRLPLVTLTLLLANLCVYLFWQLDDQTELARILDFYQESGLYEYEKARYADYFEARNETPVRINTELAVADEDSVWEQFVRIQTDPLFLQWLQNGKAMEEEGKEVYRWRVKRSVMINRYQAITMVEYGLQTGRWSGFNHFSHMFLHAGVIHLLGSLLFLGLVGLMVENLLGRGTFLGLYIASGFVAAGFDLLLNPGSLIPGVGASGAISGVLGIGVVLFGSRKIPVFNSSNPSSYALAMPLFMILPLWIANELVQLALYPPSIIHTLSHFGGLATGAALVVLLKQGHWLFNVQVFNDQQKSPVLQSKLADVEALYQAKRYRKALSILRRLYHKGYREREVITLYYRCSRVWPDSRDFHRTARAIFLLTERDKQTAELIREIYHDYVSLAQPGPRFNEEMLYRLAERFVDQKWCDEVDKIMSLMRKKKAACLFKSNLPYRYAQLLASQGRTIEGTEFLKNII
jgi:membrane associated rhomboid family serine protease